ncbi:glycosyl hydrolase [Opitutus terrae]|uniref:Glycoside hydrolase family 2 sugar binding n=1 Tax=Opitutus terrae (strain DSM 11246 / JCM 15787 / PB90-1) TaxID=452637 RepID=B1ZPV7_OPITP|nr:glycosyl hydrolase [Opitutus terrae]ACB75560.1 glycoside hydrolase family 2 sugar binding [Opitutus terrae PB90-1]
MKRPLPLFGFAALLLTVVAGSPGALHAQPAGAVLEMGFRNPPDSAKPRTWWHWTMSNVTKDGITKDLEWMKRVGLGGFQLADVNVGRGQEVEPKTPYGTPAWYDAVRHAAAEADRLGLEMSIFSSPGWSETGGPWVKPEQAMKKLVWSETVVDGGKRFSGKLASPPNAIGQIRDSGASYYTSDSTSAPFYADAAVVAYRVPAAEPRMADLHPRVSTHEGEIDGTALLDDKLATLLTVKAPEGGAAWVQFEFAEPFTARAITLGGSGGSAKGIPVGRVLASDDGVSFRPLVTLPGAQLYRQGMVRTFALPETTARFYRIELTGAPLGPAQTMSQAPSAPAKEYVLSEAVLHSGARVHRWEEKAGFSFLFEYETVATPEIAPALAVAPDDLVDLTAKLQPDGSLEWDAPPGRWTILRLGYSLTGAKNRPATPAGTGYEADKLSRRHMEAYVRGYFDPLQQALGPLFGKSLRYVTMDGWEAGTNNWTDELPAEFRRRRGYAPTPYLPALTGRIVGSADVSDRFLWDFRRTLADLWAEAHYGTMAEKLRERGVGIYAEAAGVSLEMPEDTLLNKSKVEIPMGEFWVRDLHPRLMYLQDIRGAASAAHVYGKPLVAAEAFTGGGYEAPATLKNVGDTWLAQGVNRIVFHTSAHQPLDTKPGNMMVGTHLHRNITWAEQARPIMTYFARSCFLLQQGRFVADLAYLLDEGAPSTPPIWGAGTRPTPPAGYDYDFVNADVLLHRFSSGGNGKLMLPDGMSYRVLVLPDTDRMRPELVRKLRELVLGGATIVGRKPTRSPSLADYPRADAEVHALAAELWGDLDGVSRTVRRVGKGTVVWGLPRERVLSDEGIAKDFDADQPLDAEFAWLHRRAGEIDLYYVANLTDRTQAIDARFRVSGREAELWHPDTGKIERVGFTQADGRTTVPLRLAERDAVFVVFRRATTASSSRAASNEALTVLAQLNGSWDVSFPPNRGAPARVELPQLGSWTEHPDDGIKYFSGTATYRKTIAAPREWFGADSGVFLDLGRVGDLATVRVNGVSLGVFWKPPYLVDVSGALRPGENQLEIEVTNQWTNRLIGDRSVPLEKRVLGDASVQPPGWGRFGSQSPVPSGLIGPVRFVSRPLLRVADSPDASIAGIPVNYTEAKAGSDSGGVLGTRRPRRVSGDSRDEGVGTPDSPDEPRYTLPDPLALANGQPVRDAQTWLEQRRPELVRLFEQNQFGRAPGRPAGLNFDVFEKEAPAFGGRAIRRQVTIRFSKQPDAPQLDVLLYLPAPATKPVPVVLNVSFTANNLTVDDPGVKPGWVWNPQEKRRVPADASARRFGRLDVMAAIERGLGVATLNYGDIDPDAPGAIAQGVRQLYLKPGRTAPAADEWGTIAAWAWGISRVVDYFETDADVDAQRVAIVGVSRLGKTVLWAGASDPRIALVIASCSGEGGAALSRRNYGETIAHLVAPTRYPYQFAGNYQTWATRVDECPIDAHELVALIAPRPLLLQTGTTDIWSDPKGEYLAALAATPVYRLFGKAGLEVEQMPVPGVRVGDTLSYYMHEGGHGLVPGDWEVFLDFVREHLER